MRWLAVAIAAALVGLLSYGLASQGRDASIEEALERGERRAAPLARLPQLTAGGHRSLQDYRGKLVVLNFWASWCPPCVDELPLLERTHLLLKPRDGLVVGINAKDVSDDAIGLVRRFDLSFPTLRDRDGQYAEAFGAVFMPETFIIDRAGRVAAMRRGPVDQAWLDEHVMPLL